MKIVYMGTPDFAVPALEMLVESGHDVSLVVTKPDRPQKRGNKVLSSPVKMKALGLGIPVSQPEQVKGSMDFFNQITDVAPDLIVVAAYGKILPVDILDIPALGSINIHASILPKYRGSAPIHRAIENGESVTGVTLMYMSEGMDEGDIIDTAMTEVDHKNTGQLHDELAKLGAVLLRDRLADIESGQITRIPQDNNNASYASMVEKEDAHVDFSKSGLDIERLVRAMTPFPGAYAMLGEKKMKIVEAKMGTPVHGGIPGEIVKVGDDGIVVKAGDENTVVITKLRMPGKKAMDTASFLRGNKLETGQQLR